MDAAAGDYGLAEGLPAIDAGTDEWAPDVDSKGDVRPVDGDGDGIATVDIGADEYTPCHPIGGVGKMGAGCWSIQHLQCSSIPLRELAKTIRRLPIRD